MEHKLEIIANDGIRERNDIDWKKAGQAIQSNFATNRDMQVQDGKYTGQRGCVCTTINSQ